MDIFNSEMHRKIVLIKLHKTSNKGTAEATQSDFASGCEIWAEEGKTASEIHLGEDVVFMIRTPTADLLHLSISVLDSSQKEMEVAFRCKQENIHEISFCPPSTGEYRMIAKWDEKWIKGSPFQIAVTEKPGTMQ